jgi:iron complex outermembrane receptor protein
MLRYISVAVSFIIILLPGFCVAEEEKQNEKEIFTMDEVVVTATRFEQEIEKIPANVSVIDKEDIKNSNAKNITDILKYEEGVTVRDKLGNGKTAEVDLRGFGETGSYNILVLVDGRRVNGIDLSGIDWTQIPLEQIERIEIVRGTGSVLYGDNAVGGVVNIITRRPSEGVTLSVGSVTGSFGRNKERVSISGGHDIISGALFASHDSTNGYRPENEFMTEDIGGRVVYDHANFLSLNISGSYHKDEFDLPGHLTEAQYLANREMNAHPLDKGRSEDYYFKSGMDLALTAYDSVVADLSYRKRDSEASFPDPEGIFPQGTRSVNETWSITPRFIRDKSLFNHENTFITGIDIYWSEQKMDSLGGFLIPLTTKTGYANTERDSIGIYFNDELALSNNLILTAGARHERVEYSFNQRDLTLMLAPLNTKVKKRENAYNIGISYLYDDRSSLFFRADRSIRFPLTDEVSYVDWVAFVIMAKTNLQPQKGQHYEVGIRHYFKPGILGTFTIYRVEIDNEIFYNPLTFSNENHPETLHQGFEEDPYQGNDIPAVPKHRVNLGFRIHNILPGLVFSADYNYTGSRYAISDQANNFGEIDDHYNINGKVSYEWKSISAFLGINNITNQEYSEYEVMDTFLTTRNFYPAPERNWTAGLAIDF